MAPRFAPIPDWPGYSASRSGVIIGKRGRPLTPVPHWTHGGRYFYFSVCLTRNGKPHKRRIHQLIMATFGEPKPFPRAEVRHIDGDRTNNSFRNLAWGSHQENMDDRRAHGHNWNTNKTECPAGHEYTSSNTYVRQTNSGITRRCKACVTDHRRAYRKRKQQVGK